MIILILLLLTGSSVGRVHEITHETFPTLFDFPYEQFTESSSPLFHEWFIMFYAPWCGHCKRAKPAFESFEYELRKNVTTHAQETGMTDAEDIEIELEKIVHVGIVNCDEDKELCNYFSIRGYPTFLYITRDRQAINYRGPRTVQQFMNFTENHDPDVVETAKLHGVNTGVLSMLKSVFGNQIFLFISLFLIAPFFFGYCFMSRNIEKKQMLEEKLLEKKEDEPEAKEVKDEKTEEQPESKKNV